MGDTHYFFYPAHGALHIQPAQSPSHRAQSVLATCILYPSSRVSVPFSYEPCLKSAIKYTKKPLFIIRSVVQPLDTLLGFTLHENITGRIRLWFITTAVGVGKEHHDACASPLSFSVMKQLICLISQNPVPSSRLQWEWVMNRRREGSQLSAPTRPSLRPRLGSIGVISLPVWCLAMLVLSHYTWVSMIERTMRKGQQWVC